MTSSNKRWLVAVAATVLILVGLYAFFNPAYSHLAPKCAFKVLTGYDCPSCGGQRVLHTLLNGRVEEAFWLNPFLFVAVPYLVAVAYTAFSQSGCARKLKPIVQHPIAIGFYLFLYIAWWVIRNTSLWRNLIEH